MRKITLIIIITASLFSCKENTKSNNNIKVTNIEDLIPGPIVNDSLSKKQLDQIKNIHQTFIEVNPISLKETISNFKRDQNPDNEIFIWLNMAKVFKAFTLKNVEHQKLEVKKEAFRLILMRSMMSEKEAINKADLKLLNENKAKEILKNYSLDKKPIKIERK
ncbi:hypothetical protein [uncultured Olleya sp.]|uniref:hypothetical protein n=1 Tax=uncultured Olleya sp. TaxID=757243 RepID=UPI002591731A|nr:hypothetical protein [uncultured Olleya sp.]